MSRRRIPFPAAVATLGLAASIVAAIVDPRLAAVGWLYAAILATSMPVGALTLLLTGKLTGGLWVESARAAVLLPLSRLVPLAGLAFIPLLFLLAQIYPWAAEGARDASVGAFYLTGPSSSCGSPSPSPAGASSPSSSCRCRAPRGRSPPALASSFTS